MSRRVPCEIGHRSDEPCTKHATSFAERWGINKDLSLCAEHAAECRSEGWPTSRLMKRWDDVTKTWVTT